MSILIQEKNGIIIFMSAQCTFYWFIQYDVVELSKEQIQ